MEEIKNIVYNIIQGLEKKKVESPQTPEELLKKFLTKKELKHIKIKYFQRGILRVGVDSSVWLYAMGSKKEEFLKQFNLYGGFVKDVQFFLVKQ